MINAGENTKVGMRIRSAGVGVLFLGGLSRNSFPETARFEQRSLRSPGTGGRAMLASGGKYSRPKEQ